MRNVCIKNNRGAGERIVTFIVYLNDEFKGGQTNFPRIGLTVQPQCGKAIVFWNTDPNENLLEESRHEGLKVIGGKKYIYTKWSHLRPVLL
jgi:prolyl 4-hydroxylase